MRVDPKQAETFCISPPSEVGLFLLFGPAASLIITCLEALRTASGSDDLNRMSLNAEHFKSDKQVLAVEANSSSLMGGRRLLVVRETPAVALTKATDILLEQGFSPQDCWIVIDAGELTKSSKLYKLCENHKACAVIPCYEEEASALLPFVERETKAKGLNLSNEECRLILTRVGNDRALLKSSIEKIALYLYEAPGNEGLELLLGSAQEESSQVLIDTAFSGRQQDLSLMLEGYGQGEEVWQALIWALFQHLELLDTLLGAMAQGQSPQNAVAVARPPIFWKRKAAVTAQLALIKRAGGLKFVAQMRARLAAVTLGVRGGGFPVQATLAQYLLSIAVILRS